MKTLTGKDLINTYITNDNGKLLKLYMETCASVGLHAFHDGNEAFDAEFYRDGLFIACNEYSDPSSEGVLQLFMTEDDLGYELTRDELAQMNIDNLATQTPEEKEVLDLIDTTPHQAASLTLRESSAHDVLNDAVDRVMMSEEIIPREHLVKMVEQQTIAMKCLNDELNALRDGEPEWKNGDECLYMNSSEVHKFIGIDPTRSDFCYIKANCSAVNWVEVAKLSKPESQQQREERERLEAAYDLYCDAQHAVNVIGYDDYDLFKKNNVQVNFWLAIVDKTNYRKESN